ncbi:MAG TPA: sigma-54-dependent Fis family transcriptional regulator [Anoxybacillus sp.]|nr:sigma-54-dependent Fis family transcriptional regulator [Anoxybacillus sp.]
MKVGDPLKQEIWNRFVHEGALDPVRINKRVAESWYLCRQSGVNPYDGKGKVILNQDSLMKRKKQNQKLLHMAIPFLENLQKVFERTKAIFLLVDRDGYVLYAKGNQQTLKMAESIRFVEGVKWTEDEVGTNAIGTALRIKEPITVVGLDHYSVASQQWGCSAAPIYNEQGEFVGIINVSYPIDDHSHEHVLAAVVSAAYAIEQRFHIQSKEDELELLKQASNIENPDLPLVLCNEKGKIVWVNHCLRHFLSNWKDMYLEDLSHQDWLIQTKFPLYSTFHHDVIGYRISIQKKKQKKGQHGSRTFQFDGVKGTSKIFENVIQCCVRAAKTDITVHITGETGTGKEIVARSIHLNSSRKNGPFIAVNCGAIPKDLIGSELFGYVEGAFTGAKRTGHKGKFEQANGGTLFLDEIGEIPYEMQVALLRVLQEKQIVPIGGTKPIPLDIRIITATHRDLHELVRLGKFREDLFYRIYVYPIHVPPLRQRKQDLPYFIQYYCEKNNWTIPFTHEVMEMFMNHDWPGNIRELFNVLERIRVQYEDNLPDASIIHSLFTHWNQWEKNKFTEDSQPLSFREQMEKNRIMDMLEKTEGNVTAAAAKLNIPRSTFYRKLKKYGLS